MIKSFTMFNSNKYLCTLQGVPKKFSHGFLTIGKSNSKMLKKDNFPFYLGGGRYSNFKTPCTFYIFFLLSDDNVGKYYFNWKLCLKIKKSSPPKKIGKLSFFNIFEIRSNQQPTSNSQLTNGQNTKF